MTKKVNTGIFFTIGFVTGVFFCWIAMFSSSQINKTFNRTLAGTKDKIDSCAKKIENITDKEDIDIFCTVETDKEDRGADYKVKSIIKIKTNAETKEAVISVRNKIKEKEEHVTEADYCTNCSEDVSIDLANIDDLEKVSSKILTQVSNILTEEEDNIEEAVEKAYELQEDQKSLDRRIAKCRISKESTVDDVVKLSSLERMECRAKQLQKIADHKERTGFFHSDIKSDLWDLVGQKELLPKDFFSSKQMLDLNNPDMFDYNYFSVRSSFDMAEKYSAMRHFMNDVTGNKAAALSSLTGEVPGLFYGDMNEDTGRLDRALLTQAWKKNYPNISLPQSLLKPADRPINITVKVETGNASAASVDDADDKNLKLSTMGGLNTEVLSPSEFKSIVNSPDFQKLYQ